MNDVKQVYIKKIQDRLPSLSLQDIRKLYGILTNML